MESMEFNRDSWIVGYVLGAAAVVISLLGIVIASIIQNWRGRNVNHRRHDKQ